jgi:indole-3-pyruvate monooxygenase
MTEERPRPRAIIIGAGPAGLAVAASLGRAGIPYLVLERADTVGSAWRNHYDRLHLHTTKKASALPFLPFPKAYPRYPSRDQVVEYLEEYARTFAIEPRFGEEVVAARRIGDEWEVETTTSVHRAPDLVVATGINAEPYRPSWPGQELYRGNILHAADYRTGEPFRGRRVLVVGIGNTGGEIAIDLCHHGATVTISVRATLVVMPRDFLGVPLTGLGFLGKVLPPRVVDRLFRSFLRLIVGDLTPYGIEPAPYGPLGLIADRGRIPLIDVGTVELIRRGRVRIRPKVERFFEGGVVFADGRKEEFDVVLLATGYRPGWSRFLRVPAADPDGRPQSPIELEKQVEGLWFCGMTVGPGGMLRQIREKAAMIAASVSARTSAQEPAAADQSRP